MESPSKTTQFKIDWKIKNFCDFPSKKGQLLSSPTFVIDTLHNSKWVLQLYPAGDSDGNGQCTALYLVRNPEDEYPEDIVLDCEMSFRIPEYRLFGPWKTPHVSWKTTNHTFKKGGRCGSQGFLEKSKIFWYLENDTLSVSCVVFHIGTGASRSGGCVAVSLVGTDQMSFDWNIEDFEGLQSGDKRVVSTKSASTNADSITMSLSMTSEKILMVEISPVDGKTTKRAFCSLYAGSGSESVLCGKDEVWFNEVRDGQSWRFPLMYSKEDLLEKQVNSSLHLQCYFKFSLGIEFGKVESTYYRPLTDLKNDKDACSIM